MNLEERIKAEISCRNKVNVPIVLSEKVNILLDETANSYKITKELLIEMAINDFIEKYNLDAEKVPNLFAELDVKE